MLEKNAGSWGHKHRYCKNTREEYIQWKGKIPGYLAQGTQLSVVTSDLKEQG